MPWALSQFVNSSWYNTSSTPYFDLKSSGDGYLWLQWEASMNLWFHNDSVSIYPEPF
jgi:hypothetical protein